MATASCDSDNAVKDLASEQSASVSCIDDNGEEEEEDMCRICRTSGNNLFYPCACSGSIKYVHQDCLLQWLNHSHTRQCEVCKHPFRFTPVYAENTPTRLSYREFVLGLAVKAGRALNFFWRLGFVISIWLMFVPLIAFWIWRLMFVRSLYEAPILLYSRFTPSLVLTDCLCGFLLSAGILFIFVGATCIRDHLRHLRELGGIDAEQENNNLVDRQDAARAGRRQLQGHVGDRLEGGAEAEPRGGGNREFQGFGARAGQLLLRNAENVAARIELQAARHVEQIWDAIDAGDGAEDVPFDELFGMHGPVFEVVEHACTLLASNAIFLGLVVLVPFTLGRIVLHFTNHLTLIKTSSINVESPVNFFGVFNTTMGKIVADLSQKVVLGNGTLAGTMSGKQVEDLSKVFESSIGWSFSDAATVAAGYTVILLAVCSHLGLRALINYSKGEPVVAGCLQGIAFVAQAAPAAARRVIVGLQYIMTMFKVFFVLFVELGVFPLLCGFWLDVCSLSILGGTIANHVSFFWTQPLTSCLLHWLCGVVYMLHISIFVSLLREVLRPGVLYFLRDPADPNYNPFHDLVEDPIQKHARRVLLSVVVYGSLVVLLIFLPMKLAVSVAPSLFPLDIRISDPFAEIPADMLLFHICIPFAIEHFRPKATIKTILFHWFSVMGWVLGLSDFLLPREGVGDNHARGAVALEVHQGHAPLVYQEQAAAVVETNGLPDNLEEYMFARILLLLVGAWVTLLVINSTMMLLPVSLGRLFFYTISRLPIAYAIKCNDLYAFNIGCYMMWATIVGIKYSVDYCKKHNIRILVTQVLKWTAIVTKSLVLLSLWVVVIPVLIGLLFELLVVIPLRVPIDESPVFLLYQDWALGLVFLKIWTRLAMLGQVVPLVDESWRNKFERVKADGFTRLRGFWVMREIVGPILVQLLTALCVPYVFARGLFPALGYSLITNSAVYRFAWSGCLMLGMLCYMGKCLRQGLVDLHNMILDDRYLIGKRLHNFEGRSSEEARSCSSENQPDKESPASSDESFHEACSMQQTSEETAIAAGIEEQNSTFELLERHGEVGAVSS